MTDVTKTIEALAARVGPTPESFGTLLIGLYPGRTAEDRHAWLGEAASQVALAAAHLARAGYGPSDVATFLPAENALTPLLRKELAAAASERAFAAPWATDEPLPPGPRPGSWRRQLDMHAAVATRALSLVVLTDAYYAKASPPPLDELRDQLACAR